MIPWKSVLFPLLGILKTTIRGYELIEKNTNKQPTMTQNRFSPPAPSHSPPASSVASACVAASSCSSSSWLSSSQTVVPFAVWSYCWSSSPSVVLRITRKDETYPGVVRYRTTSIFAQTHGSTFLSPRNYRRRAFWPPSRLNGTTRVRFLRNFPWTPA